MYEEFISNLSTTEKYNERFLVKGLKLSFSDSEDPLSKIADEYYLKKENILVFGSPLSGKLTGIVEIVKKLQNYIILTDKDAIKYFEECCKDINVECGADFDFENNSLEFIIFYNLQIPFDRLKNTKKYTDLHLSGFYDYIGLYNPNSFKDYISKFTENFPADFTFTTISKYPQKKIVQFIFGTEDSIKHLSIQGISENKQEICLLYSKCEFTELQLKYFDSQNVTLISSIPNDIKANKFIFYDINIELFDTIIDRVDSVYVIYTKNEFDILKDVVNIAERKGIPIPETIKKLTNPSE